MKNETPAIQRKNERENEKIIAEIDYNQYEISEGVHMRMFDEEGLPYDPERKIREIKEKEEEGEIVFELNVGVKPGSKIKRNVDFEEWEMTEDQKEVFEALECEEEGLYEELEDDFVLCANAGIIPMRKKKDHSSNFFSYLFSKFQNYYEIL